VFRKAPPVNSIGRSCLDIAGSDGIRSGAPMFLSDRLVSEGALRSSVGGYHHATFSRSMVKSSSRECHGCRVLENCIGGLSLCGKEELAS
jgi:hypothetical protein